MKSIVTLFMALVTLGSTAFADSSLLLMANCTSTVDPQAKSKIYADLETLACGSESQARQVEAVYLDDMGGYSGTLTEGVKFTSKIGGETISLTLASDSVPARVEAVLMEGDERMVLTCDTIEYQFDCRR